MAKKPTKSRALTKTTTPNLPAPPKSYGIAGTVIQPDQLFDIPSRKPSRPGPWTSEPDKLAWQDAETGLHCIILRQRDGTLGGYVAVPPGHELYGFAHDAIPGSVDVEAYNGLSYAEPCNEGGPVELQICHATHLVRGRDGKPDQDWWFGFTCNSDTDYVPGREGAHLRDEEGRTYRDAAFVFGECTRLARQLAAIGSDDEPNVTKDVAKAIAPPKSTNDGEA